MPREWTIDEVGELIAGVQLLRTPTELASALNRDPREVEEKIGELGLARSTAAQR
jgi:hypothetical protein